MSGLTGGLTFVGNAVKVSAGPPVIMLGGHAFAADGSLVVVSVLPVPLYYANGIPVNSVGAMFIVDKAAAVAPKIQSNGGLQYDASGAVVTVDVGAATAPTSSHGQLTFDASGALVTSA